MSTRPIHNDNGLGVLDSLSWVPSFLHGPVLPPCPVTFEESEGPTFTPSNTIGVGSQRHVYFTSVRMLRGSCHGPCVIRVLHYSSSTISTPTTTIVTTGLCRCRQYSDVMSSDNSSDPGHDLYSSSFHFVSSRVVGVTDPVTSYVIVNYLFTYLTVLYTQLPLT